MENSTPGATFELRTPRSRSAFSGAQGVVPGGVSRQTLVFPPYPFYVADAAGSRLTDVDGNEYVDFVNNYTSLIHGHGFEPATKAAADAMHLSAAGAPFVLETEFAETLCDRLPAVERLHFTTTGSEATMYAARVARAATRRDRLLTFEGGFHGSANEFVRDVANPALAPGSSVPSRAASVGLEPTSAITAVYNDLDSVTHAFRTWGHEVAAVILEPFLGNSALIEVDRQFLDHVVTTARAHGALLILDEVQALRLGYHGSHGLDGYTPDLVAVGKIMGGGFPLAAFGGRADLMSVLDGLRPELVQTGTFTASPVALAAGHAAMEALQPADFERLDRMGELVRSGLRETIARHGFGGHVNGRGSMFNVSFNQEPVTSYAVHQRSDFDLWAGVHSRLLSRGMLVMSRGTGCLSTAHTDDEVAALIDAFDETLTLIRRH